MNINSTYECGLSICRHYRPPNSTPRRLPSYLLLYFRFVFYIPRCTVPDFPSTSSQASLTFLSCCHRTTTTTSRQEKDMCIVCTSIMYLFNFFTAGLLHLSSTFAVRETASLGIMGAPQVTHFNPSESIVLSASMLLLL